MSEGRRAQVGGVVAVLVWLVAAQAMGGFLAFGVGILAGVGVYLLTRPRRS